MGKISFVQAMRSQPETLAAARRSILASLGAADLPVWQPTETIGVVAMGASSHSGQALAAVLRQAGIRAVNLDASSLQPAADGFQPADHYIVVSESGRSPEPIAAARLLTRGRRITISNFPDAQIGEVTDYPIDLGGFDDSPVYTTGYTATLLAYALLLEDRGVVAAGDDLAAAAETVAAALDSYDEVAGRIGAVAARASSIDVVGQGPSLASAGEAALMFREGLRIPTAVFETYQYLHGPMEAAQAGSMMVLFGDGRELTVPGSVLEAGVQVVLVTSAAVESIPDAGHPNLTIVRVDGGLSVFVRLIVEAVIAQLVLAHASEHLPFPLEEFRYEQLDTKLDEVVPAVE